MVMVEVSQLHIYSTFTSPETDQSLFFDINNLCNFIFHFQFQDEPSGPPNMKFNRKLLNDFEYESEDEPMMLDPPLPTSHSTHGSHSTHTSHSHSHTSHSNQPQQGNNTTDAMAR